MPRKEDIVGQIGDGHSDISSGSPAASEVVLSDGVSELRVTREYLTIGGVDGVGVLSALHEMNVEFPIHVEEMVVSPDFTTEEDALQIEVAKVRIVDLGFADDATLAEITDRAAGFGMGELPAEAGPHRRLSDTSQPMRDRYNIFMQPITKGVSSSLIFRLGNGDRNVIPEAAALNARISVDIPGFDEDGGLRLNARLATPRTRFSPNTQFLFKINQPPDAGPKS